MANIEAYQTSGAGEALHPTQIELAELGPLDVEIDVSHCGVCHSDVHLIDGDWGDVFPLVPGHEVIGTIAAVGAAVQRLEVGQRVGVGWQSGSCMECAQCLSGDENLCRLSVRTCISRPGGFAERIRTDSRFAFPIPESMASENAAPLLCAGITVYTPLRHQGVRPWSHVGVIGIGGLGHLALQFARAMGCEVTALSTSPDKEAEARAFGAHHFIATADLDRMKAARGSMDFILSTVNVNLEWKPYLDALRPKGTLSFVGIVPGALSIPQGALTGSQRSVTGSAIGSPATMVEMLEFAARNNVVARTQAAPMSDVNEAVARVRSHQARYRIVLAM